MKQKKNPNKITLLVSERELEVLGLIQKNEGQRNLPLVVHDCILNYYKIQYFNKLYMQKGKIRPIEEAISDEQYCEMLGGRVGKNSDGNLVCIKGAWSVPLDQRVMMKNRFKE